MKEDIKKMLPSLNDPNFQKTKMESPYAVLTILAEAINEKYDKKITAQVVEMFRNTQTGAKNEGNDNPIFSFYLQAPIGHGYLYRLLEVEQLGIDLYPVSVRVFQRSASDMGKFDYYSTFYNSMVSLFSTGFVSTIILNLIGQVELYRESRTQQDENDF